MSSRKGVKVVSLRISEELYKAVARQAKAEKRSVNALIEAAIEKARRHERDREWAAAFAELADDPDSNVEWAIHAASEVVLGDE